MTTSANPIIVPTKSNAAFAGYYASSNSASNKPSDRYIEMSGNITTAGLDVGKALTNNSTWYAHFVNYTVMSDIYASCSGYICTGVSQSGNTYTFSRLCASSNLYFASDSSGALYCITPQRKFDLSGWNTQQDKYAYKLFYKTVLDIDQGLCEYTGFTYTASNPQEQRCSSSTAQDSELFVE